MITSLVHEFRMETVFDKILQNSQKWFLCAHTESQNFLCFELQQIRAHIYYSNGGHLYSKCGLGFAEFCRILSKTVSVLNS